MIPPQSTAVSSWFCTPSVHDAALLGWRVGKAEGGEEGRGLGDMEGLDDGALVL